MMPLAFSLIRTLIVGALGVALVASTPVRAADVADDTRPADAAEDTRPADATEHSLTPEHFAREAAMSGMKEVYLGKLALEKASRPDVKEFAQMMIKDHSQANQRLLAVVKDKGYVVPPTNAFELALLSTDNERQLVREPGSRPGRDITHPATEGALTELERDSPAAVARQLPAREVLSVHRLQEFSGPAFDSAYLREMSEDHAKAIRLFEQAQTLKDEEVQRFAKQTLPTLQRHHQELQELQKALPTHRR